MSKNVSDSVYKRYLESLKFAGVDMAFAGEYNSSCPLENSEAVLFELWKNGLSSHLAEEKSLQLEEFSKLAPERQKWFFPVESMYNFATFRNRFLADARKLPKKTFQ